ncbi:MAG: glycosyltransferase family 39 protein [Gemmatimonadales bacterium]
MTRPPWPLLVVLSLVLAGTGIRIAAALRPGLWVDEIFSLAMATGHSLEHPASEANPSLGDFVEPRQAQSPSVFRRYVQHEEAPVGVGRVVRAVLLSDTSPPLYYLLLNWWTRTFGTGDAALRLFSVWWAVLALPLLWLLGREFGRRRVAWSACLLFSLSPIAIYYSAEGRMYSLVWFLALGLGWLTLGVARRRSAPWLAVLWVLFGAAGLLSHYFFAFVWVACLAWLCVRRRPDRRWRPAVLAGATVLAVLPWYLDVPASVMRWRVTGGWLTGDLAWPQALSRPFALAASLLSGGKALGLPGWNWADRFVAGLCLALAIWIARQGLMRRMFSRRRLLLWGWVAAACVGPLVFDLVLHTKTTDFPRYALAGLPAAMLLVALGMSHLPPKIRFAFLSALLLAWLPGSPAILSRAPRPSEAYREVGARLESRARPDDVVLVQSTPPGVIGVARYLRRDIPLASWVAALQGRRVPADLQLLLGARSRVALVKIHDVGGTVRAEPWLLAHTRLLGREVFHSSPRVQVLYFGPSDGDTFFPERSPPVSGSAAGP